MSYRDSHIWLWMCAHASGWWYQPRAFGQPPRIHPLVQVGLVGVLVIFVIGLAGEFAMSWSPTQHQAIVQYLLLAFTFSAGLIAFWYALETRGIRRSGDAQTTRLAEQTNALQVQLNLSREQHRASFLPYLVPVVYSRHALVTLTASARSQRSNQTSGDGYGVDWTRWQSTANPPSRIEQALSAFIDARGSSDAYEAMCIVDNVSDKVAYTVWVYASVGGRGPSLAAATPRTALEPRTSMSCGLTRDAYGEPDTPIQQHQVEHILRTLYGQDLYVHELTQRIWSHEGYVAVTFQTYDGEVYAHVTETEFNGLGEVAGRGFSSFRSHLIRLERAPKRQY